MTGSSSAAPVPSPAASPPGDRLDSWKEIAAYFNRDKRTVQRWERQEGMPVHRHQHDRQGSVYALRPELDEWWRGRRARIEREEQENKANVLNWPIPADAIRTPVPASVTTRYEVMGEMGSGGMGVVYKARDRETGEVIALKVLRAELANDPLWMERFKEELRLARRITHKNVCRIESCHLQHLPGVLVDLICRRCVRVRLVFVEAQPGTFGAFYGSEHTLAC